LALLASPVSEALKLTVTIVSYHHCGPEMLSPRG